jgi:hypothetical protein
MLVKASREDHCNLARYDALCLEQGIRKFAGENDRSASARSNGAGSGVDPFSHQLRSMHDEVGSRERRKSDLPVHDSSGSSWPNTQGSVSPGLDHMLSAMRSIPCWDAGTLGALPCHQPKNAEYMKA